MADPFKSGYIAVVGRPNVGKSTLINGLLGQKLVITSPKPQTTRHRILGIKTTPNAQYLYLDTPGLTGGSAPGGLARTMDRAASEALSEADCVVLVAACPRWREEDERVCAWVRAHAPDRPIVLAVNKVDRLAAKEALLPLMADLAARGVFADIVPVSARGGTNLDALATVIAAHLPARAPLYPEEQLSDRSERFLAAEFVREQVFRRFAKEIPYVTTVSIEEFRVVRGLLRIRAVIYVEKEGQKAILVGRSGAGLKAVGTSARRVLESHLGRKVYLGLWVKVRGGWADNAQALRGLGYGGDN